MEPVLPATCRIDTGGLDVAVRPGADPHVLPRRRDGQRADPVQPLVLDQRPVDVGVGEPTPCTAASVAGSVDVAAPESHPPRMCTAAVPQTGAALSSPPPVSAGRPVLPVR